MKRFTFPRISKGVKYQVHVYVTESWQFLEDQFTWLEKVRGGKVPPDVVESFRRLYKIAKDNKVSFMDLCVYALGTAAGDGKTDNENPIVLSGAKSDPTVVLKELAAAKQRDPGRERWSIRQETPGLEICPVGRGRDREVQLLPRVEPAL